MPKRSSVQSGAVEPMTDRAGFIPKMWAVVPAKKVCVIHVIGFPLLLGCICSIFQVLFLLRLRR